MNRDHRLAAAAIDRAARAQAEARQAELTKPPGSLGRLEELAVRLAGLQGSAAPCVDRVQIVVFAADHGVSEEGVSAFPSSVTLEMVRNFARGGAAINVLARAIGAALEVVNLGTVGDPGPLAGVIDGRLGPGTQNFARVPAMSPAQCRDAMQAGREAVERARQSGQQLFIGGEMGIGNTSAACAMACVLLDLPPERLAGPGTGLNPAGVTHKAAVIRRAIALHRSCSSDPGELLRRLGGFEVAALVGSYLCCAQHGLPVLVDGYIASVAALTAARLCPPALEWFLFAHTSAEPGHREVLAAMHAEPLLEFGMRLGEGSGAATAVPLLRLACALHNGMATFTDAGVSTRL
ncbi:MAG: nicotinate-nucleotide--dimethylbenzimidazole phosphoribosyltransferase [Gammaproteobacteria bacterium]